MLIPKQMKVAYYYRSLLYNVTSELSPGLPQKKRLLYQWVIGASDYYAIGPYEQAIILSVDHMSQMIPHNGPGSNHDSKSWQLWHFSIRMYFYAFSLKPEGRSRKSRSCVYRVAPLSFLSIKQRFLTQTPRIAEASKFIHSSRELSLESELLTIGSVSKFLTTELPYFTIIFALHYLWSSEQYAAQYLTIYTLISIGLKDSGAICRCIWKNVL